jgi:hypothetical protein
MKRPSRLLWGCLIWAAALTCQPAHQVFAQTGPPPVGDLGAVLLVPAGAVWRYLDDGSIQDDAWRLPDFPDSDWKAGPAQFGYGDGDEATVVGYGSDPTARHITTWFRHAFEVADANRFSRLVLNLVRDDGAVVYLNGRELVRDNLPAGPISSQTLASSAVGVDENQFHRYDLSPSSLVTGRNVLAVEVHQANPASSDLSFDAQLVALAEAGEPWPAVSIQASVPETIEPSPTTRVRPGELTIIRTGSTDEPLIIFLQADGTATPGLDYEALPDRLEFPAGQSELRVNLLARDDQLVEGPEVVRVRLVNPPTGTAPTYLFGPNTGAALIVIFDDEPGAPEARLDIVHPAESSVFPMGSTIRVSAIGVYAQGEIQRPVLFYAGDRWIGQSEPLPVGRPPIPGLPSVHTISWTNPPPGSYALTARTELALDRWLTSPPVSITVGPGPGPTWVSLSTDDQIATEMDLTPAINLARFRISRTGDLSRDLLVFYSVHGSARPDLDYPELPGSLRVPSGEASATFDIVAKPDDLSEGMETVYVRLEPSPLMGPLPTYEISAARDDVAIILDHSFETKPAVEIVWPKEGDRFTQPTKIEIVTAAYHPTLDMSRVDFYDGDTKIGDSWIVFDRLFSGGLIVHRFNWADPPGGTHTLTAHGFAEGDATLPPVVSPPVHITVEGGPALPTVHIEATGRIAEEDAAPLERLNLVGEFTISRTGPTDQPLSVFVHYSGMATPGADYPPLPWLVTIAAGAASTTIRVEAMPDGVAEGIETLVAALSHCPPETNPPMGMPCVGGFEIDPAHERATVFIRDDGITEASVSILRPADGTVFRAGQPIPILAVAIDLRSYLSRVEFWEGDRQIGVSEIAFIRAPDPGTPIEHWFEWRDASPGAQVLTARARRDDGTLVVSAPVHITVGPVMSQPPRIAITHPAAGAQFPLGSPVEVVAETVDPDGYVPLVEFFADGVKIGERRLAFIRQPDPGQPQTFTFVWRWPMPGPHVLTARATDDDGDSARSAPVEIQVTAPDLLPVVRVIARDPWAVEPQPDMVLNTADFRIRRFGPTNAPLEVAYSLHGTASNGVDYEARSGSAIIPAGERWVDVLVRPLADDLAEGIETVILRLEDTVATDPPSYRVGFPRRAVALISDHPRRPATVQAGCLRLPGGLLATCFGAETGAAFRIEGSADLCNWETVSEVLAVDGAVYFVDDEAGSLDRRFYRVVSDPFLKMNE